MRTDKHIGSHPKAGAGTVLRHWPPRTNLETHLGSDQLLTHGQHHIP